MKIYRLLIMVCTIVCLLCLLRPVLVLTVSAQVVEVVHIPDKNLEQAVREEIEISDTIQLTQAHMRMLSRLDVTDRSITNLSGLEYATNITILDLGDNRQLSDLNPIGKLTKLNWLSIAGTQVSDLSPLSNLNNLRTLYSWGTPVSNLKPLVSLTSLVDIDASGCKLIDVNPLVGLTQLKYLKIRYNLIEDITPIAYLTQLIELNLSYNQIVDIHPLAELTQLEKLWIQGNKITDYSPIDALSLTVFEYDESCVLPRLSVDARLQNRRFPSVFSAWGGIGWSSVLNLPEKSDLEHMALHDLYLCCLIFNQEFRDTPEGKRVMGFMMQAVEERDTYLTQNPNMLFIVGLEMREAYPRNHPENSPYWLRDENGERVVAWKDGALLLDFTKPVVINKIVQEAIAVAQCGLYDGIFFDWWNENGEVLANPGSNWKGYVGLEAEQNARDEILRRIRAEVSDDFLILVNGNRNTMPRTGWAINGTFMETLRDSNEGYTYKGLKEIESTLSWAENNLREPRINCLEGWGVTSESPDSPLNQKWMRVFTTMSLTHSDGYVLYNDGIQHQHYWYDFWDTDLGHPVGDANTKGQLYDNRDGIFIREFTNGWAVYNRSGKSQQISLPTQTTGVASGITSFKHTIPDLDGEIYLKTGVSADINDDGVANILDLVLVASKFGLTGDLPEDINHDGIVNILDLVIIANVFNA